MNNYSSDLATLKVIFELWENFFWGTKLHAGAGHRYYNICPAGTLELQSKISNSAAEQTGLRD